MDRLPRPSSGDGARARARAATPLVPVIVSDATALAVVGLTPRQFRSFVREHKVPHLKSGRRTLARLDRVLEVIDRLSGAAPRPCAVWDEDAAVQAAARCSK